MQISTRIGGADVQFEGGVEFVLHQDAGKDALIHRGKMAMESLWDLYSLKLLLLCFTVIKCNGTRNIPHI